MLRVFLIAMLLHSTWLPSSLFMMASNRHRRLAHAYLISAVLALMAMALLIRYCGLLSVPLGLVIGEALACYHFVIKDACEVLKEEYAQIRRAVLAGSRGHLLAVLGALAT